MSKSQPIGVGVIGLGFMGQTHLHAYESAGRGGKPCRVMAVCDRDVEKLKSGASTTGNIATGAKPTLDLKGVKTYTDPEAILADPAVQAVSICTHTDTHVDLTIAALRAGKHVLVEKPLATNSRDARRATAEPNPDRLRSMPGLCMRFWPGWAWLKNHIDAQTWGPVRSAVFERLASPPAWSPDFYKDAARTGGALIDLHIHDADFVRWCFGDPQSVASTGTTDHLTTLYRYERGRGPLHVVAEGGWDHSPGFRFRMRYVVVFEKATAEFESDRASPLSMVHNGEEFDVDLESITGWDLEVQHFIDAIASSQNELIATLDDGLAVAELLEAEAESLRTGQTVAFRRGT